MKMISPMSGDLRCTTYNAIEAQLKMGATNIFVQLKAYDIQVCLTQCPLHILIYLYSSKHYMLIESLARKRFG